MAEAAVHFRPPLAPPGRVALLGNPNCGKTALFNLLTGSRQKVANYAGVTVERKEGELRTPSGRSVDGQGIEPDVAVTGGQDAQTVARTVLSGLGAAS